MKLSMAPALALLLSVAACTAGTDDSSSSEDAVKLGVPPPPVDVCANLAAGPFTPGELGTIFSGSEDFTFDGAGGIVGKRGNDFVSISASPTGEAIVKRLGSVAGQTWGVRYQANGNLLVASPGAKKIVSIAPDGTATDFLTNLASPNGLYVDHAENVWLAEFGGRVSKIAKDGTRTVFAQGPDTAQGADGLVVDEEKGILFYDEYQKGKINRIATNAPGSAPVAVATIPGAALDGMLLDQCGNILVLDNGRSKLFRVRIDAQGNAAAAPELLATFPKNVAAANFGVGPGFDPKTLYVTGNPGTVYTIPLGVGGKSIVAPAPPAPPSTPVEPPASTH